MKFLTIILASAFSMAPALFAEPPDKKIKVLLVDGFSNHNWQLNTALIRGILESAGNFKLTVSTSPPSAATPGWDQWRPRFSDYHVVIQTCNDIQDGPSWPQKVQEDFESFVRNGGGVFIYHSANNAFPAWDAYDHIIGLGWRRADQGIALAIGEDGSIIRIPKGEGRGTGHGERVDAVITRIGDHPIHKGLPRRWKTPDIEIYHYARGPAENVNILSFAFDSETRMRWPIEWTVNYGKGRVYTATYGHVWKNESQPERMRCAAVQRLMVRAMHWLARSDVMPPIPADFPTEETVSIRNEIPIHGEP